MLKIIQNTGIYNVALSRCVVRRMLLVECASLVKQEMS